MYDFIILTFTLLAFLLLTLPQVPDDKLTPGEVAETDVAKVCVVGYSATMRHTSEAVKAAMYREYHITNHKGWVADHRISLDLGGADTLKNLQPQSIRDGHLKDRLEVELHHRVCSEHTMTLRDAQRILQGNWISGYRRYCRPIIAKGAKRTSRVPTHRP